MNIWGWWVQVLGGQYGNKTDKIGAVVVAVVLSVIISILLGIAMACAAGSDPFPVPDRARDGDQAYCMAWSQYAVGSASRYVRVSPEVRKRALVIIYQNREQDRLHPEAPDSMVIAGVEHPVTFVMTQGAFSNGQEWEASPELQHWIAQTIREGWKWMDDKVKSGANLAQMRTMPVEMAQRFMFMDCMGPEKTETKLKPGLIRVASSERLTTAKQELCLWKGQASNQIMRLVRRGVPRDEILGAPKEQGISDEQISWVAKTEAEARAWQLGWHEFVDCVYAVCMDRADGGKCASILP